MINGIEGIPGSGKSYEAVAYHVLPALKAGRKVITNLPLQIERFAAIEPAYADLIEVRTRPAPVRGTWDANSIGDKPAFQLFDDGHLEAADTSVNVFGHVWDYYTTWRRDDGIGPLYIIDEAHVPLPSIKHGRTSKAVIEWFKLHRHFNADVLLLTQNFRDVDSSIATLIATLIKCREASIIGKKGHYIRKVHAGYRGAVIQQGERKYEPKYFGLYKSHTQGRAVQEQGAQDVDPFLRKFRWVQRITVVIVVATLIWAWQRMTADDTTDQVATIVPDQQLPNPRLVSPPVLAPIPADDQQPELAHAIHVDPPAPQEPAGVLDQHQIHITGYMRMGDRSIASFVVSNGSRKLFDLTSYEIEAAGYTWEQLTPCAGWLIRGNDRRAVTCDAPPLEQGGSSNPIVIDTATGTRTDRLM